MSTGARQSAPDTLSAGVALFRDYVRATKHLAGKTGLPLEERATGMLQNRIASAARALQTDPDEVLSRVLELALARAGKRPPPIYVAGLGGSGSHWLTGMLVAVLPVVNLDEAPIPADLRTLLEALPASEQGLVVDCLHLSYAATNLAEPGSADLRETRFLQSGIRVVDPRHRLWDPECSVIYLLRDPRDQALCFTFRKREFRQLHYSGASDERYLDGCAVNNARNYAEVKHSPVEPDFVCRFEELKASAPKVLERLAAALGYQVDPDKALQAAREHDSGLMRSGVLPLKGNLFSSESLGWREEADERQKLILHSRLTEVVTDAGYPADECLGRPLKLEASASARRLCFPEEGGLGVLYARKDHETRDELWTRIDEARGIVTVQAGSIVKLRVNASASTNALASLVTLQPDGLDSLCLAGNRIVDDALLSTILASLRGIQELDLAHTAVSGKVRPVLSGLPRLRGVSLLGTEADAAQT